MGKITVGERWWLPWLGRFVDGLAVVVVAVVMELAVVLELPCSLLLLLVGLAVVGRRCYHPCFVGLPRLLCSSPPVALCEWFCDTDQLVS